MLSGNFIRATGVDSSAIYFFDYNSKSLKRFDILTLNVTTLGTFSAEGSFVLDADNIYMSVSGNIYKIPKAGGSPQAIVNTGSATAFATDDAFLYCQDGGKINRISVNGGSASPLAGMVVTGGFLYWTHISGGSGAGKILRVSLPVTAAPAMAAVTASSNSISAVKASSVKVVRRPESRFVHRVIAPKMKVVPLTAVPVGVFSQTMIKRKRVSEVFR